MRRIKIFSFLVVFGLGLFVLKDRVFAAIDKCELGSRYCSGSYKVICNPRTGATSRSYCSAGCTGGSCRCSSISYSSWGACNNGYQTRTIISKSPSGCVVSGAVLSRTCCDPNTYTPICNVTTGIKLTCSYSTFQPQATTCQYGCKNSTQCAACNSSGGCETGYHCASGSCVKDVATCSELGGRCIYTAAICRDYYGGSVNLVPLDCTGLDVCCVGINLNIIACTGDSFCQLTDSCQTCVNPGTINSHCESTRTSGGSGRVGGANGSASCTMPTSGLCASSYGVTVTDSVGDDGTFNWTCEGQPSGTCRSSGSDAYGSATRSTADTGVCGTTSGSCSSGSPSGVGSTTVTSEGINNVWSCVGCGSSDECSSSVCTNQPVVNGSCHSNITGTAPSDLCYGGSTPVYSSSDANHDYINDSDESEYVWGCQGSRNTCAEGDGTDQLNCSSTMNQKSWYQVNDGNILAKGKVTNYVPKTTCDTNGANCKTTVSNGGIYSKEATSVSDFDGAQKTDNTDFSFKTYSYDKLKAQYFDSNGVGTVLTGENISWANVKNTSGVIFVDGDLEITDNLETSNFVMVVAKGTITINPSVTLIDAILVADKVIAAEADAETTASVSQLVINGMIHGVSGVEFSRSLLPNDLNNTSPSVVVNYNPELLFMVPAKLSEAFSQWKVN